MTSKRWSATTKIVVVSLLILLAGVLLFTFRAMIRPTIIAFLLTFVLHQPVNWVQRRTGWSRGASVVAVYLFLVLLLLAAPALFIPRLVGSAESLASALATLVEDLQSATIGPILTIGEYQLSADSLLRQLGAAIQDVLSPAAAGALGFALSLTTTVLTTIYVLVLGFWLLKDINLFQRTVYNTIPADYREDMRRLGMELTEIWHAFLRGQLLLGLVIGIMTWIVMAIVGLPNAAGFALLAGVMEFLPTVGPGISGTIGTLFALVSGSTWMPIGNIPFALIVMILYIIITQIESVYLIPRLVGRRVHLHPAVTFAGIISAAVTFGVLGVLLITPTIASARAILTYVVRKLLDEEPFEAEFVPAAVRIPGLIAGHRIQTVLFDLDGALLQPDLSFAEGAAERFAFAERLWPEEQRRRFFQRFMVILEGPVHLWMRLLIRFQLHKDAERMTPYLNRLHGFAPPHQVQVQPGVPELLQELSLRYNLGLISFRPRRETEQALETAGIPAALFPAVVTMDDLTHLSPQNEAVTRCLSILGTPLEQTLLVGDTEWILRPAQATSAVRCGVLCGLGAESDFIDADLVLPCTPALRDWL